MRSEIICLSYVPLRDTVLVLQKSKILVGKESVQINFLINPNCYFTTHTQKESPTIARWKTENIYRLDEPTEVERSQEMKKQKVSFIFHSF